MIAQFTARRMLLPDPITAGEIAVQVRGVSLQIDGNSILRDVSLELRAGEVLALVGPNGAGKSSLLGVIAGDLEADGEIEIDGLPLAEWTISDLARRRAVLAQQNSLSFPFRVIDVVEMGRTPWARTIREDEDDEAVLDAMQSTQVLGFAPRLFPSLSGGERARVSMARVLAQRTGILMLDEPTAALDVKHQEDVLRVARDRAALGDAVIVVLHDLSLAAAYADRVAILADGAVHSVGSPSAVLTAAAISEVYDHPVDIIHHPVTGDIIVVPVRSPRTAQN